MRITLLLIFNFLLAVLILNDAHAKSKFNFSLNVGPQYAYPYPVYTPYPVYQPYFPPPYPVYREIHPYPYPVFGRGHSRMVCSYDYWGNPYNCYWEYY